MRRATTALACLCALAATGYAQPVVTNPSFEDDGAEIKGVGYVSQGNAVAGWRVSFPIGVGRNTQGGPFMDNGVVPDGMNVCVLQNLASIAQTVQGLQAGQVYRLGLRANARGADAPDYGGITVEMNGTALIAVPRVSPVGVGNPYHTLEAMFVAGTGSAELAVRQTNPKSGVSVLLDDVRIEMASARPGDRVIQVNPASFLTTPTVSPVQDLTDVPWIWTNETPQPARAARPGRRVFRREFRLVRQPARAFATFTADNDCRVMINGKPAGWSDAFSRLYTADITHLTRIGRNVITVEVNNAGDEPNPAGIILKLVASFTGGGMPVAVTTDRSWRWSASPTGPVAGASIQWKPVTPVGDMGCAPWGWVGPTSHRVSRWFPEYRIPGDQGTAESVRQLFSLHFEGGRPQCTLWDGWQGLAGLWPVRGRDLSDASNIAAWKQVLLNRDISPAGYVASHQHRGFGHSKGWPIALYMQTGGVGFHFSLANDPFGMWVPRVAEPGEWKLEGLAPVELDRNRGWVLRMTSGSASVASPSFDIPMAAAPFIRVEWEVTAGKVLSAFVQWKTADRPEFDGNRRMEFAPITVTGGMAYSDVPICDSPTWSPEGRMTGMRLGVSGADGAQIVLKSIITPADTRHNINNPHFIQGSANYLDWTGDVDFLRRNIARMRKALAFSISEFRLRESLCVDMPWFGHDGRSGFVRKPDGDRASRWAVGVGNNYWDLLPFGGKDTLSTIYHYDALRRMARIERLISRSPQWRVPDDANRLSPEDLEDLAERIKEHAGRLFWNADKGRFVACIGHDGEAHDYGYTIVNLEATHYGFATPDQARSILEWLDGARVIPGDTSQGPDIYAWRFGPRSSTLRNTEWYSGMWEPLNVPWGDQVQDGGGVLGFSYFDLMARLKARGPDDALRRLKAITRWFNEVQSEGGYRSYYAKPGRGTLQGGGPPGGLGLDYEFVESALVPQIMLYGFLGLQPGPDAMRIDPKLPSSWPSLTITRIRYHGLTMDITATRRTIEIAVRGGKATGAVRCLPPEHGRWTATVSVPGGSPAHRAVQDVGVQVPSAAGAVVILRRR